MTQHINAPTRGRGTNKPATLDLVFTSNEESIEKLDIDAPLDKSDHSVLKFWYRCRPEEVSDKKIADYGKGDFEKMKRLINIDWKLLFHDYEDDIDQMWEIFYKRFQCAEEECIPQKVVKSGKRKFKYPLDRASLRKRKKKNRLWKRYMITRDMSIYEEYCRCRNQFRRLTRKAAKNIEREIASKAKLNNKAFWKFVNAKTKIKRNIPSLKRTRKPDAELVSDDYEIGNILGIFFSSVYTKEPDWSWDLEHEKKLCIIANLNLEITKEIVAKKLINLNIHKSPGPDKLHPRVFKELAQELDEPLFLILKSSLKLGKIPSAWKLASITPIYKNKGDKQCAENFRPVSLTSIACKLMESMIRDAMLNFLKSNGSLSNKQFGFLGGRSTVIQLLQIMDKWTEILDRGGVIDVVYCDFQKAFDTVPHKRLIEVLAYYGFTNPLLSWVKDFLTGRTQQVIVNGCISRKYEVTSGVPQGSVLGPVLFVIYINLLIEKSNSKNLHVYADDLKIFEEIKGAEDADGLQKEIDTLYDWTQYSFLKLHPGKCVVMRIKPKRKTMSVNSFYDIDQTRLKIVKTEKDLGIVFDDELSFREHINCKVKIG